MSNISKRELNKQLIRARLLSAGFSLFQAKGFDNVSIDEIAEEAKVARSTFFNYFPGKEDLLCELALQGIARFADDLEQLKSEPSVVKRVVQAITNLISESFKYLNISWRVILETMKRPAMPDSPIERFYALLEPLIVEGQQSGELRGDAQPNEIAREIFGIILAELYYFYTRGETSVEMGEPDISINIRMIMHGIAGDKV